MNRPPDEPPSDLERFADAIAGGEDVEWEAAKKAGADPETLEALRLIHDVSRMRRAGVGGAASVGEPAAPATPGTERTWGRLVLRERIGEGTYGEVWRAFDPGLRLEVALKLWRPTLQPRIVEQLLHEARALARIRHPNVLRVLGADGHDGRVGMWTELLEGATLERLLADFGPCTWREAALFGIDACRALSAVHAAGLVHRDVKGANLMRERGGRVVLMDFGSVGSLQEGESGDLQGTPLAMAPEVLRGEPASRASDVYGLGAAMYRQVSGRHPVEAGSLAELRKKLAHGRPPSLRDVRPDVPAEFSSVVERALARDPKDRPASAAELERLLAASLASDLDLPTRAPAAGERAPASRARRALGWAAVATAALLVGAAGAWWALRSRPVAGEGMQFTIPLPAGEHLPQFANAAVSPDGRSVAFASVDSLGIQSLWVRRFDSLASVRLPGTQGAQYPFWSPDSRQIGFFSGRRLARVGVDGGPVATVCEVELGRGASWSRGGTIVFAGSSEGPLRQVPAVGGTPVPVTPLDTLNGETSHRWPYFLPDGHHFVYVAIGGNWQTFGLFVGSLDSDRRIFLGEVGSGAAYTSGLLVYLLNGTLEARPFDPRRLRWKGEPVPISAVPGVGGSPAEPHASVSAGGTLVYTFVAARDSRLAWVDVRSGKVRTLAVGPYYQPSVSPDGRRIAVERVEGAGRSNIWMVDAATGAADRWTHDPAINTTPIWSPAGDSVLFSSNRSGSVAMYVRDTGGSLGERAVFAPPHAMIMWPNEWRPGNLVSFDRFEPGTGYNTYELRDGRAVPVARTAAMEMRGALSPDLHWFAYDSDASGRKQLYFVDRRTSERYVLPVEGAMRPRWARSAPRLFFHTTGNEFYEMTVVHGRPPTAWPMRRLFSTGACAGFDPDSTGTRLLVCVKSDRTRPEEIGVLANLPAVVQQGP